MVSSCQKMRVILCRSDMKLDMTSTPLKTLRTTKERKNKNDMCHYPVAFVT